MFSHRIWEHISCCPQRDTIEVGRIEAMKGEEKSKHQEKMKNLGIFKHNAEVLRQGTGEFIVSRRSAKPKYTFEDFLPCYYCFGFCLKRELWRHVKKQCYFRYQDSKNKVEDKEYTVQARARMLLEGGAGEVKGIVQEDDEGQDMYMMTFRRTVLHKMRRDVVFSYLASDKLMLMYGKALLRRVGSRRHNDVAQRLRMLARLKMSIQHTTSKSQLMDLLQPGKYESILQGVEELAGYRENEYGVPVFDTPSIAIRLGHLLLKIVHLKLGYGIQTSNIGYKQDAGDVIKLHEQQYTDRISGPALHTLQQAKFNKPDFLPLTEDLVLLKQFLINEMKKMVVELKSRPSADVWRRLAEATCTRVQIFNKRRGNEVVKLLLDTYKNRTKWNEHVNEELEKSLDEVEQELVKS